MRKEAQTAQKARFELESYLEKCKRELDDLRTKEKLLSRKVEKYDRSSQRDKKIIKNLEESNQKLVDDL
jgi:hypothetical protein